MVTDENAVKTVAAAQRRFNQAMALQVVAVMTVGLMCLTEFGKHLHPVSRWGVGWWPYRWIGLDIGLVAIVTLITLAFVGPSQFGRIVKQLKSGDPNPAGIDTFGVHVIRALFFLDLFGLLWLMVISRGSPSFLTAFTVLVAVAAILICPRTDGASKPCRGCDGCGNPSGRWAWLISLGKFVRWLIPGWPPGCKELALAAFLVYLAGLRIEWVLTALHLPKIAWWPDSPVRFNRNTTIVFAAMGMLQFLYARWCRNEPKGGTLAPES
jgi:hypothetical protein